MRRLHALLTLVILAAPAAFSQQPPTPAARAWWAQTSALANDSMQGRDTGTEAYERAARYVADQFAAAHLKPAGDSTPGDPHREKATYFQRVLMHQVSVVEADSYLQTLVPPSNIGHPAKLHFSTDLATTPRGNVDISSAEILFVGYGLPLSTLDLHGKIALYFNSVPAGLSATDRASFPERRLRALASASALLAIDNLSSIEPPHWPSAYSRSVTLAGDSNPAPASPTPPILRINPSSLETLFTPHDARVAQILAAGAKGAALATFPSGQSVTLRIVTSQKDISSPNILAILPGSDPSLAPEFVAFSAHLDGYGLGTPVLGDSLYNGALDDAAYVATLIELARTLSKSPPKRSLLFCIFTGEEKGLLGSLYFTTHPTVPIQKIIADLNLDQLRPLFPLNILTMEGIADSTLGETARTVAADHGIALRPDREPERNLFRRADNFSFVKVGVPIAAFIFGYDSGSPEEVIYRDWYAHRYHKPQDDLATPIDWAAAVKFNDFFRDLTLAVANAPARPHWLPTSPYAPKP